MSDHIWDALLYQNKTLIWLRNMFSEDNNLPMNTNLPHRSSSNQLITIISYEQKALQSPQNTDLQERKYIILLSMHE